MNGGEQSLIGCRILLTGMSGEYGGMEMRMAREARMLRASGATVTVRTRWFVDAAAWMRDLEDIDGIQVGYFSYPGVLEEWRGRHLQAVKGWVLARTTLRRAAPDLAHVFFPWTDYGAGVLWSLAKARVRSIVSAHNAFPRPAAPTEWRRRRLKEAFSSTGAVVAVSGSAMDHFLDVYAEFLPAGAVRHIIPNPIDTERFAPGAGSRSQIGQRYGIPDTAFVIGSVGRLSEQKRPWMLIDLLSVLRGRGFDAVVVLVGEGHLKGDLIARARGLGILDRVVFTGQVGEVEALMAGFDVHVLMSNNEGFGMVTAEAMAVGIPVVGTDVPGTADILRGSGAGFLVAKDDVAGCADVVARLLSDPGLRAECGARGRAQVVARYDARQVDASLLSMYQEQLRTLGWTPPKA